MEIKLDTHVQDTFLRDAKEQQTPFVLYTINGFQIRGTILDIDELTILVESDGKKQMVYKRAISTVAPLTSRYEEREPRHGY